MTAEKYNKLPDYKKKTAFTLAEVLITLGIIGVVAAMTIPNLMTAFAKHRVETQLVKFYSTMNQAMRMSVADNGTPEGWVVSGKTYTYDENVEFLETYISPYLKHSGYNDCTGNSRQVCMELFNGGLLVVGIDSNGGDFMYFIDGDNSNITGRNYFVFQFSKVSGVDSTYNSQNFLEPYVYGWDGTEEGLRNHSRYGCRKGHVGNFCAKRIQRNSWRIPSSDYPW